MGKTFFAKLQVGTHVSMFSPVPTNTWGESVHACESTVERVVQKFTGDAKACFPPQNRDIPAHYQCAVALLDILLSILLLMLSSFGLVCVYMLFLQISDLGEPITAFMILFFSCMSISGLANMVLSIRKFYWALKSVRWIPRSGGQGELAGI